MLTASGLVFAVGTALAIGSGHLHLAIVLLILTGFHDLLDGPVAKAGGTASVRGAFFDSVTDRVSDAVIMGGVAWYLVSEGKGHLVLLPLAVLAVASLVSYERAKAEALGVTAARGGLMERAERMFLLGVGLLASFLLVPILWALLVLTSVTAVGRFARVWRAAEGPVRAAPVRPVRARRREGRVESRWRAWREGLTAGSGRPRAPASRSVGGGLGARKPWPVGPVGPCGPGVPGPGPGPSPDRPAGSETPAGTPGWLRSRAGAPTCSTGTSGWPWPACPSRWWPRWPEWSATCWPGATASPGAWPGATWRR